MELPLDHYRLIGVNPSANSEEILRAFQLRLDKSPEEGFTYEVLTQRAELLRLTADLLTNSEERKRYEMLVLNGASGLEFPSNREVAGLMLLWESGSPKEAFKLAKKALQPPQAPALGSSRESDLTLLAALASRDAAIKEQEQRCYVNAADFIQEGILILQRIGKRSELRKNLEEDLSALLPYRILDLISRDLCDADSRKKGLGMLESYICKRGGLEGKNKSESENLLDQQRFELFFQQIKSFLTLQEQIDLFINLQKNGSVEAGFLGFLALTALGFTKRKPDKLIEAKRIIKNLNLPGIDSIPLIGCLDLLLADVNQAEERFLSSPDEELQDWIKDFQGGTLEAICIYCKNWLENEVLKGYRDIDIKVINLDAWFEDDEIQLFIEKLDKKSNKTISGSYIQRLSSNFKRNSDENPEEEVKRGPEVTDESNLPLPGGIKKDTRYSIEENFIKEEYFKNKILEVYSLLIEKYSEFRFYIGDLLKNNQIVNKSPNLIYLNVFLVLFLLGIGLGFFRNNSRNLLNQKDALNTLNNNNKELKSTSNNTKEKKATKKDIKSKINLEINKENDLLQKGLTAPSPTLNQIEDLLNTWLISKSQFLAAKKELNISKIVKKDLIDRLQEEKKNDVNREITKDIVTKIQSVTFLSQSSSRIAVLAELKYVEKILNNTGQVINETSFTPFLKVKYIFGYSNNYWKLADYVSGM